MAVLLIDTRTQSLRFYWLHFLFLLSSNSRRTAADNLPTEVLFTVSHLCNVPPFACVYVKTTMVGQPVERELKFQ